MRNFQFMVHCHLALVFFLATVASAQTPTGLPFEVSSSVPGTHAGNHLNFSNSLLDNGEFAIDHGGASETGINPFPFSLPGCPPPLNPLLYNVKVTQVSSPTLRPNVNAPCTVYDGTVCEDQFGKGGFTFRMIVPDPRTVPLYTAALNATYPRSPNDPPYPDYRGVAVVIDGPTRKGNLHSITPFPAADWNDMLGWGMTTIRANDELGLTPAIFSVQRGLVLGGVLRNLGYQLVLRSGGSYGGLVGQLTSAIASTGGPEAKIFDGTLQFGANSSIPAWEDYHAYFRARQLAEGGFPFPFFAYHDQSTDQIETVLGQYGLHRHDVDLIAAPRRFELPTLLVHGLNDYATGSDNLDSATKTLFAQQPGTGGQFLRLYSLEEAGHGEPQLINDPVPGPNPTRINKGATHIMEELGAVVAAGAPTMAPATGNVPRTRKGRFDHVVRHYRNPVMPSQILPIWEVGKRPWLGDPCSAPYGQACAPGRGLGSELSQRGTTSIVHGGSLYTLGLEGYLTRHPWINGKLGAPNWRYFVGIEPQCMEIHGDDDGTRIYVGSQLGLVVLDPNAANPFVAHSLTHSKVRAIEVADLSAWTTRIGAGPHVIYVGDNHMLTVLDSSYNEVLTTPIGAVARIKVRTEGTPDGPRPFLYASLLRGHVGRFSLEDRGATDVVAVANMLTKYLHFAPINFEFVNVNGTPALAIGGSSYESPGGPTSTTNDAWIAVHDRSTGAALAVSGSDNRVSVSGGMYAEVEHMFMVGNVLYLGILNFASGQVVSLDTSTWTKIVLPGSGPGATIGGGAMTMGSLTGGSTPDIVRFPYDGSIEVYDIGGASLLGGLEGRTPTSAVTLDYNPAAGRTELCILDPDWMVRRYDAANGSYIDKYLMPQPRVHVPQKGWTAMNFPKKLLRTDPSTFTPASFQFFSHAGTMFPENRVGLGQTTTPMRVAWAGAGLTAAPTFTDQHDWLVNSYYWKFQESVTGLGNVQISPSTPIGTALAPMSSEVFGTCQGSVITVDVPNDGPNLVFANQAGNVRVVSSFPNASNNTQSFNAASPWASGNGPSQSPGVIGDAGDTILRLEALDIASLAAGELDGNPATIDVVAGAMIPDAQGHTLFVLDVGSGSAMRMGSANVGSVSGLVIGDVDLDGQADIVVGTVEGRVRVYDQNLNLIIETDLFTMQVGHRGTMWLIEGDAEMQIPSRLITSHSQGVTALDFNF